MTAQNLSNYWLPYTANRYFKKNPKMVKSSKGMYYTTEDNQKILDATSGLWCVNAGHNPDELVHAIQKRAAELDYSTAFQIANPDAFKLATKLSNLAPEGFNNVFFTNSGSESADTSLKIALAYHKAKKDGSRFRLIGRDRGYHGCNFGGMSVGGIVNNRKLFGPMLSGVDHICHTLDISRNAYSKGLPENGEEYADDFEKIIKRHDASTIAALIIEPIACSGGVIMPPKGYLKKIRELCTKYGILLIFDEVITAFGRIGGAFAADVFGVVPDIISTAKGLTNGSVPMGAVLVKQEIYDAMMQGDENIIEFFHGYTYSSHPLACAAGLATIEVYEKYDLFERSRQIAPYFEKAVHSLKGIGPIVDIRNYGLIAAIELAPDPKKPGNRAFDVFNKAFEQNLLVRASGDVIALSPPLIIEKEQIDLVVEKLATLLKNA